jgi:Protein of unknown function (DUF4240)
VAAHTEDLVAACDMIRGEAIDFAEFRCWLVCKGKSIYEQALLNADSLADVVKWDNDAFAETFRIPTVAWASVTGKDEYEFPYPESDMPEVMDLPLGEDWDINDPNELRRRLPRLSALYLSDT